MYNINKIIEEYKNGKSMREIARDKNTNHKMISRILGKNNIKTREPKMLRGKRSFSDKELPYQNMATHLRFEVDYKWLLKFEDFKKLKFLNRAITNRGGRYSNNTDWYKSYIIKFYNDKQFCFLYDKWIKKDRDKWHRPTIDHINPKAKGGENEINNLQFLSWFENRSKNDISQVEWNNMKNNIKDYLL